MSIRRLFLASLLALCACSSSTTAPPATTDTGVDPAEVLDSEPAVSVYKTHVILGDSISAGGGEAPFFYDLLDRNDDGKYPTYTGKDLKSRFGSDLAVVKASKGGATATGLLTQAQGLPTSLAGPVLVTITIGGNDVQAALAKILSTGDDSAERADFANLLDKTLAELTKADRFGAGVKVSVLLANIYDPSDGTGNFTYAPSGSKCGGALKYWPSTKATSTLLDPWEKIMVDTSAKYPATKLLDLRGRFNGHGVAATPTWFVADCIHPNAVGHEQLRELFWDAVVTL